MDLFTFPSGPCGGWAVQIAGDAALILLQLLPFLRSAHLVHSLTHWRHDRTRAACGPITELAGTKDCTSKTDFLLSTIYFPIYKKKLDRIIEIKISILHFTVLYWLQITKTGGAHSCSSLLEMDEKWKPMFFWATKENLSLKWML